MYQIRSLTRINSLNRWIKPSWYQAVPDGSSNLKITCSQKQRHPCSCLLCISCTDPSAAQALFRLHYTQLVYRGTREAEHLTVMRGAIWPQRQQSGRRLSLKDWAVFLNWPQPLTGPWVYMIFMACYSLESELKESDLFGKQESAP